MPLRPGPSKLRLYYSAVLPSSDNAIYDSAKKGMFYLSDLLDMLQ